MESLNIHTLILYTTQGLKTHVVKVKEMHENDKNQIQDDSWGGWGKEWGRECRVITMLRIFFKLDNGIMQFSIPFSMS